MLFLPRFWTLSKVFLRVIDFRIRADSDGKQGTTLYKYIILGYKDQVEILEQ